MTVGAFLPSTVTLAILSSMVVATFLFVRWRLLKVTRVHPFEADVREMIRMQVITAPTVRSLVLWILAAVAALIVMLVVLFMAMRQISSAAKDD
jgi:hypothetical protein